MCGFTTQRKRSMDYRERWFNKKIYCFLWMDTYEIRTNSHRETVDLFLLMTNEYWFWWWHFDSHNLTQTTVLYQYSCTLWIPEEIVYCISVVRSREIWQSSPALDSLWPSDTIWRHKSGSTLAQVMACCLMAPSHYLNQCWLIISKVQWHSSQCNFTRDTSAISHWN